MRFKGFGDEEENRLAELWWLPYLLFLTVTAVLAIPILRNLGNWGIRDWDLFTTLLAAAVRSILEYGQFPFWNPYIGGGNILFAHPEVPVLNPLFGLLLIFGPLTGLKLQVLVVYFIGMAGFYKLARQLGISFWGSLLPPSVFMLSSYLTLHFVAGHVPFHYFCALPWLLYFYKKSLDRPLHILSAGGVAAFMILGSGAAVPLLFSLFFLFLFSLFDIGQKHKFRPPFFAVLAGLCGILFAAVKFFPMFDYLVRHPWIPERTVQTTPLWILPDMFFNFNQSVFADHIQGYFWGWHEYGAFIGLVVALLAIIGLIVRFKKDWPYLVLIIFSLLLVLGSFFPALSLWDLLHHLPGFKSMRVPSRFSLLAIVCVAILAGRGADAILSLFKHRKGAMALVMLATVLGTHLFVCLPVLGQAFRRPPEHPRPRSEFKQIEGDPNRMYTAFLSNMGTIKAAWLSAYRPGRCILGFVGQTLEWYSDDDAVRVIKREFSPNRIAFEIETEKGGNLVISQGYDPGWRREDGGEIKPRSDLVSFDVAPGENRIEIYYYPRYFTFGLVISIISILMAIAGPIIYRLKIKTDT